MKSQAGGTILGDGNEVQGEGRNFHPGRKRSILRKAILCIRSIVIWLIHICYRKALKMDLHPTCRFSLKANLDFTNPRGVHVGPYTYIAFNATILSHDMCRRTHADTRIGAKCFIGAGAIILPGISIGDECIIGSGTIVTKNVPSNSVVVGNPGRVVRQGVKLGKWGIIEGD